MEIQVAPSNQEAPRSCPAALSSPVNAPPTPRHTANDPLDALAEQHAVDDEPEPDIDDPIVALVLRRVALTPAEVALFGLIFGDLMKTHHKVVWAQFRRRGLTWNEAEDLVQDTFLDFHLHVVQQGFPGSIPAFLTTMAQHRVRNYLRDQRREPVTVCFPSSGSEKPASGPEVERVLDLRELYRALLPPLSAEHRAVIEKVVLNGLTHTDAALALNIAEGTVKSRLIAAKRALHAVAEKLLPPSQRGAA
ncbi:MAG: RNA polymerase sigma factor [Byssovorax sp.]